jgi:hypothetical protein
MGFNLECLSVDLLMIFCEFWIVDWKMTFHLIRKMIFLIFTFLVAL